MGKQLDSARAAQWRERLERLNASNLSVSRFCEQEGVSTASIYWWRRKLATPPKRSPFQRVELSRLQIARQQAVVRLPEGVSIELGSDPQLAAEIVESLVRQLCGPQAPAEARRC